MKVSKLQKIINEELQQISQEANSLDPAAGAMVREISPEEQATQKVADTSRATTWAKGPKGQAFGKVSDTLVKKANIEYPNRNNKARISDMLTRAMAGSSLHKPWDPTTGVEGISDPRMQKRLKRWTTPKGMTRTARKKAIAAPETVAPQQRKTAGMPATRRGAPMQERLQKIIQEEVQSTLQEGWWDRYKRPYRDIANTIYDLVAPPDVPVSGQVPHESEIDQSKVKKMMKHGAQPWEHTEKLEDAAEQANAAAAATALLTLGLGARSGQAPTRPKSTHTPITFSGRPGPGKQTLIEPVPESWLQRMLSLDEGLYKIIQEELEGVLSGEDVVVAPYLASGEPVEKAQRRYKMGDAPYEYPELAPMSLAHGVDAIKDELARETGPAYEDWRVAYEDPYHPEHEEAVLATPAMDPQRHVYPEKWKAMTADPQIVQEELK